MKILIVDGQGGRMGSLLIEKIKECGIKDTLIAVGTNSTATAAMLKAGANLAATGEHPVIVNSKNADFILGPIGIIAADSLMGEITPAMANATASCSGFKILLPVSKCSHYIAGVKDITLNELADDAIVKLQEELLLHNSSN